MKYLLKTTVVLSAAILFTACSGNDSAKSTNEINTHDHSKMEQAENTAANPVLKNDKVNAVYQHYIHLTTALTNSDMAEAKVAANAIEAGAKELDGGNSIASSASIITTASDIEVQRTAFAALSKDMETLIKKDGLSNGQLYVDFCPMALNDKGATWITASKEIRNPYFGKKMMECGEVQDTLK